MKLQEPRLRQRGRASIDFLALIGGASGPCARLSMANWPSGRSPADRCPRTWTRAIAR